MAEQFAFEQLRGYGRAVLGDEGFALAAAVLMQRASDNLFPGPGLAEDQHGGISVGGKPDHFLHATHRFA